MDYNKGTGAGGKNTNHNGKVFEEKTDNEPILLSNGFTRKSMRNNKYSYYLEKIEADKTIHFVKQSGLKNYMKTFHKKTMIRNPDEAYIIITKNSITIKILEKKNQNGAGSVEDKLCLGHYFKFVEYPSCLDESFHVDYAFCLSGFLKNLYTSEGIKWNIIRRENEKNKINVFFGEDDDYFAKLNEWINSS